MYSLQKAEVSSFANYNFMELSSGLGKTRHKSERQQNDSSDQFQYPHRFYLPTILSNEKKNFFRKEKFLYPFWGNLTP
jgi:hypothetical protein